VKPRTCLVWGLLLALALLVSSRVQPMTALSKSVPSSGETNSLVFTFKIPPLQITQGSEGVDQLRLEGFEMSGAPGDPTLLAKAYNIALPPDVVWESVKVDVVQAQTLELAGAHAIAPAPPGVTWIHDRQVVLWGKNAASIVDGKNTRVYQNDAYFPPSQLSSVKLDQMRKWRFVSLLVTPVQYNPVTGKLRQATEVQVRVTFERAPSIDAQQLQTELSDTVMDDRAAQVLYNYDQAQAWYPAMARPAGVGAQANYVIITTNAIVAASAKLNSFIAHKQDQGYSVLVVTEDQYGGLTGQWPNRMAEKIRQWLKNNYQPLLIQYVLLIGDPTPYDPDNPGAAVGDVPMKMCWPAHRYLDGNGNPLGQNIPTDYLYADLTGNWDLNTHGQSEEYCGELTDDEGTGGMNFYPEVYVGRIPVYRYVPGWPTILDNILDKTIIYEDSGDLAWRKRALLPMSFSASNTDGAYLAEAMKNDYLNSAGYDSHTLYQHYWSGCYSNFASTQDLAPNAVRDHWKNRGYGIVTWWAHGSSESAAIGYGSCSGGDVLNSNDTSVLNDSRPAIVFQVSCNNGYPEDSNNLGYALLKQGAVATMASSRNSIFNFGNFVPSRGSADNASMGYYVMQRVVNGEKAGRALYDEKYQMSALGNWDTNKVGNWIDFNLYGDPTISINDGLPWSPSPPSGLTATSTPLNGINLTWTDASANELGFVIERTTNPSIAWMQIGTVGINTNFLSDSGLSCGSHYYYRLQAFNAYGVSSYSNVADAWAVAWDDYDYDDNYFNARYIYPTGLAGGGQTHTFHADGDVDWVKFQTTAGKTYTITTSSLGVNNDTVLELYDTNGLSLLATNDDCVTGNPASCINNWVAPTTGVYYVKVSNAQNKGGCSGYEYNLAVQAGGTANWPAQPTNLTATPVSYCQINLSWTDNSNDEEGFQIERMPIRHGSMWLYLWEQIASVGPGVTSYQDTGLNCNDHYSYRVRAYNANGKSFYSNISDAATTSDDAYEYDGDYASAKTITVNGAPQAHNFHVPGDEDWVKFSAVVGHVYTITTSNLGSNNDTVLELYDKDGATQLEWNDDCAGLASCINKWTAPASGIYYVRINNYADQGGCPGYNYDLTVRGTGSGAGLTFPSGLQTWAESVSRIYLSWTDDVTGELGYKVERWKWITPTLELWRQIGVTGPGQDLVGGYQDTGLTCNTVYTYRVRAFDALGDSPYSQIVTGTTPLWDSFEPDDVYTQAHTIWVNAGPQSHNLGPGMDYDWVQFTATAGEVYTITTSEFTHSDTNTPTLNLFGDPLMRPLTTTRQCGDDQRALCINGWTSTISGTVYLRVHGLGGCPGHDYELSVVDSHVSSHWPNPPTGLTGTLPGPGQLDLTWQDNSTNEHGFHVERRFGSGWLQIADAGQDATRTGDSGLVCGLTYEYRVSAYNDSGNSDYATFSITVPACVYPVAAPTSLTATSGLPAQVVLTWTDNSDNEYGFKIERSPSGARHWTQVYTTTANAIAYTDTGLLCDTTYYYRVCGYNVTGDFDYSNVASATTGRYRVYLPLVVK
jgi:hypothetical protein